MSSTFRSSSCDREDDDEDGDGRLADVRALETVFPVTSLALAIALPWSDQGLVVLDADAHQFARADSRR